MLGKLFKHEWKAVWKLMTILNAAVLVMAGIGALFFRENSSVMTTFFESLEDVGGDTLYALAYMGYFMVLIFSIIALTLGSTIYFYIRFYRNLYTDQGYLMHTLPVDEHGLIWSKALVYFIWYIISIVVVLVCFLTLGVSFFGEYINAYDIFSEVFGSIYEDMGIVKGSMCLFLLVVLVLLRGLLTLFGGYTCISIGQLAAKNKVLASIGVYFGFRVLLQVLGTFISQYFVIFGGMMQFSIVDLFENETDMMLTAEFVLVIVCLLLCWAMYAIIHAIMHKRLNLE